MNHITRLNADHKDALISLAREFAGIDAQEAAMTSVLPLDDLLAIAVAWVLIRLLGWHWAFLPSFVAKLVPGAKPRSRTTNPNQLS